MVLIHQMEEFLDDITDVPEESEIEGDSSEEMDLTFDWDE